MSRTIRDLEGGHKMRRVRVEVGIILEITVGEHDEELADTEALTIARQKFLADCGNGRKFFEDEDVYMSNYGAMVLDNEEDDCE